MRTMEDYRCSIMYYASVVPQCAMVSAVYSFDEDLIESTRGNKKRSDEDDDLWRPEGD